MNTADALYQACLEFINKRIATIRDAMADTQQSAGEETKSSAGDKYETGLSMMQIDMENQSQQLADAMRTRTALEQVKLVKDQFGSSFNEDGTIKPGHAVKTSQGNYFIAISAGAVKVGGENYFAVSSGTPIGTKLIGLKKNDEFEFNSKKFRVLEIIG